MIDLDEINDEIAKLEHSETTYRNIEKLSVLYAVRQNFGRQEETADARNIQGNGYSYADKSEFLTAVYDKPIDSVLQILDEHMSAIKVVYPKEYAKLIRKINEL